VFFTGRKQLAVSTAVSIVVASILTLGPAGTVRAVDPVLYAVDGAGNNPSSLYTVNAGTGLATFVANITISATQVSHVTGLAFDPTDGTLYGFMNGGQGFYPDPDHADGTLLTINKTTGVATVVGSVGLAGIHVADIAFDPLGNLYAWTGGCGDETCNSNGSDLYTLDTSTGTSSKVSESGTLGFQTGLAINPIGRMFMKSYQAIFPVNQFTGHVFAPAPNSALGNTRAALAFGPGTVLYSASFNSPANLVTIAPLTGAVTTIGSMGVSNVSALAWDFGVLPAPDQADLSLTKTVDDATPTAGDDVTFTITVTNGGPDSATSIFVKDNLPSGFTFVSDTPSQGSYSSGFWNVGTIANAGSATLDLTATALSSGVHTNDAEVQFSNSYDPDSVPGSGEGDTFASRRSAPSAATTLYAVTGAGPGFCGGSPSSLYELDSASAAAQKIADITIGGDPVTHVTGLAVHPSTGVLYGFMNFQGSDCALAAQSDGTLITINKTTGVAAMVGSEGDAGIQSPDMTFDPFGTLYAWGEGNGAGTETDDLYTLNTSTGASTKVGECSCGSSSTGLASDSVGRLYMKSGNALSRVSQLSGQIFPSLWVPSVLLNQNAHNLAAFGPSDDLFTGTRSAGTSAFSFSLKKVTNANLSTGTVTNVGTNGVWTISALAWDLGTITPPDEADLSLDKGVDIASPTEWFTNVTFTITVSNGGPDTATGVKVKDLLPSGLSYVSDDGSGAYNSSTGIWNAGSIANGGSATLHIIASVQPTGSYSNTAHVIDATTYDGDSVPGAGAGDIIDTVVLTPTPTAGLDAAAAVIVKGPTRANANTKGFFVRVTNVGSVPFAVSDADVDVSVDLDTGTLVCDSFSTTLAPGKNVKFRCTWSPQTVGGISPGDTVTYEAVVDITGDGFTTNDTGTFATTAT
jgi:uncharacterized repeat protein (TIGR01451 family)